MATYELKILNSNDLLSLIAKIGADPRSAAYFLPKREVLSFWIPQVDFRAAAYLKQEMLTRAGDATVDRNVIDGRRERSDVLVIGTEGQYKAIFPKLEAMSCWGLDTLRKALYAAFRKSHIAAWNIPLPGGRTLGLGKGKTKIMGILNITPDSFYSDSRLFTADIEEILIRAQKMIDAGAHILDIGAESTRPGSEPISETEEKGRLLPVLRALRKKFPEQVISVDTYKGNIARVAAENGADIINDISGFTLDSDMLQAVAETGLPYVLSHIQGTPQTMQSNPFYNNVVEESIDYFEKKLQELENVGVSADRVIIDPGIGFGKRLQDNLRILKSIQSFRSLGRPLLIGHSRKGFIKNILNKENPESRLYGTMAVSAYCAGEKVELVRVHDVEASHDVLEVIDAIREAEL